MSEISEAQLEVARRFGTAPVAAGAGLKVGVARNVREGVLPLNGLRHELEDGTAGWFIWGGEDLSQDPDFFVPVHVEHLVDWCPEAVPYLALPPGWRFLLAPGYEDVWFDEEIIG